MITSTSIDVYIGKRIRLLRGLRKFSQQKVASALGITFQQIQKYERGTNRVGAGRLYELSQILGVPIGFFFEDFSRLTQKETMGLSEEQDGFSRENGEEISRNNDDWELLIRNETLELVRLYYQIDDCKVRRRILKLLRRIAHDHQ
ncbi:helix-turn-helix domain-containing protein [Saccharibacter sp. 17.LH.SD]|uniref:helix-turn-helix domain-containing protein n=1 Tax=Saccharibacter sp. 17.LH.SD TaxID=2689393 RepID=UPI001367B5E1|nr:helix-turn-helix transcriptional regulator [Saccharibacter sp. 17.LH.SD]MXV45299.1 helix-turn-helix domain-containing protein [Saccharibacter sp. 17.LH.SD]